MRIIFLLLLLIVSINSCSFPKIFSEWKLLEGKKGLKDNSDVKSDNHDSLSDIDPYILCVPLTSKKETGVVVKVVDGDSIKVELNGEIVDVRYIGINAPEYVEGTNLEAETATNANRQIVEGKEIHLYRDVSDTDKFGRLLRYVFQDGIFVNLELVESGYALPEAYPPDLSCQRILSEGNKTEILE